MDNEPVPISEPPRSRHTPPPLRDVLRQCEALQTRLAEVSREQLGAGTDLIEMLAVRDSAELRDHFVGAGERAQLQMRGISSSVASIVSALRREIRHRDLVDHQLAAAVEQHEAARRASLHDALTGIPNRSMFHDRLDHGLAQARRHDWDLALMFIDLDNFKKINDDHGHLVGDAVLQTIAGRLRDNTRSDDTVSRHGGDEFTYLALDIHGKASVSFVAHKLMEVIAEPCNVTDHGRDLSLQVRASIGISIFPVHGKDADALIRSADRAMYQAKKQGTGYAFAE